MPLTDVNGTRLHHTDHDPGGTAGTVVALHSFCTSGAVWRPLLPFLPPGVRLVAPDARNHGRSARTPDGMTIDDQVRDVEELIERLGLDRPLVVGSSIGATYATELALRRPDLVRGAVLVGAAAHGALVLPGLRDGMSTMVKGLADDPAATAAAFAPGWFGPLVGPRTHAWTVEQMLGTGADALRIGDEVLAYDPRPLLPGARVPFTYVHGGLDAIPLSIPAECADLTPGASLVVAEPAAHMPHIEMPGWFADVVLDALGATG